MLFKNPVSEAPCPKGRTHFKFHSQICAHVLQSARVDNAVDALEEMGGLISPLVLARVDYQEAARHGLGVTEINPQGSAAQEMRALWNSLKRRMNRGKGKGHSKAA